MRSNGHEIVKPKLMQLSEMIYLLLLKRNGPGYYLCGGFNVLGRDVSLARNHFTHAEYSEFIEKANALSKNSKYHSKIFQKEAMRRGGVTTPKVLLAQGKATDPDQRKFDQSLEEIVGQRVVVKPDVDSGRGRGVQILKVTKRSGHIHLQRDEQTAYSYSDISKLYKNAFLVEEVVQQHEWYKSLHPHSVNTFRIWIISDQRQEKYVLGYLRMGRGRKAIDNQSAGGLVSILDADLKLGKITDGGPERRIFTSHPDTHMAIEGNSPPMIADVITFAKKALAAFPGLAFAGLDVAVTAEGPTLIEINPMPDRMGAARCGVPMIAYLKSNGLDHLLP
jgi:hypothetical protein